MKRGAPTGLSRMQTRYLRAHRQAALALLAVEETPCRMFDFPEATHDVIRRFARADVIEQVDTDYSGSSTTGRGLYEVPEGVRAYIREEIDAPETLPCGHTGIRNLGGGRYTCTEDDCDAAFNRETARAAVEVGDTREVSHSD